MKKSIMLIFIMCIVAFIYVFFAKNIYISNNEKNNLYNSNYLFGESTSDIGSIKIKVKVNAKNIIKEIGVIDYDISKENVDKILQKLIISSLEKENSKDVIDIENEKEISVLFKNALNNALQVKTKVLNIESDEMISLTDEKNISLLKRDESLIEKDSFKIGIGAYAINSFSDALNNKLGDLKTDEYICMVLLNRYNSIEKVSFDHISSNINFDKNGIINNNKVESYIFLSDKLKVGYSGIANDSNFTNIAELERFVLLSRTYNNVIKNYGDVKKYSVYFNALKKAIDNAKYYGSKKDDFFGTANYKVFNTNNVVSTINDNNTKIQFDSYYGAVTVDKKNIITSNKLDMLSYIVNISNEGKILGKKYSEVNTISDNANELKYTKMPKRQFDIRTKLNKFEDLITNKTISNIVDYVFKETNDLGIGIENSLLSELNNLDLITLTDVISRSFENAIRIK